MLVCLRCLLVLFVHVGYTEIVAFPGRLLFYVATYSIGTVGEIRSSNEGTLAISEILQHKV